MGEGACAACSRTPSDRVQRGWQPCDAIHATRDQYPVALLRKDLTERRTMFGHDRSSCQDLVLIIGFFRNEAKLHGTFILIRAKHEAFPVVCLDAKARGYGRKEPAA